MAAYLAKRGNKILLIDFEAQRNLSIGYGIPEDYPYTVFDMLNGDAGIRLKNKKTNLYILPGSEMIDTKVYSLDVLKNRMAALYHFFKEEFKIVFDYAIIDCSPSDLKNKYDGKGKLQPKLNQLALYASDAFIIPLVHEKFAVDGFSNFIADAISFKAEFNPSLTMGGVFFNKVEENTRRFKKYYEIVKESIPEEYFIKSYVRKDVLISDAADEGKSIFELAPNSRSAKDYSKLCRELLTKIN